MNAPTRETARRGFWIASLIVPGWAQLMAGRISAIGWFIAAGIAWFFVGLGALTGFDALLPIALSFAGVVHMLSGFHASALGSE